MKKKKNRFATACWIECAAVSGEHKSGKTGREKPLIACDPVSFMKNQAYIHVASDPGTANKISYLRQGALPQEIKHRMMNAMQPTD